MGIHDFYNERDVISKKEGQKGRGKSGNMKKKKWKKVVLTIFVIILIMVIAGATAGYIFLKGKLGKMNYIELNKDELEISDNVGDGYRNIALFAVDARNIKSYEGTRSDGIIIATINEKTKEVTLTSVYRDTYVPVENHGYTKITHAYAYGGPALSIKTLNKCLDLNISEFASVNFKAVADSIDLLGGVEVTVEKYEVSELAKYTKETADILGVKADTIKSAGTYNLTGVQAVAYGRIRKIKGGDYKRTERMRTIISKAFEKAKKMDPATLNKIIDTVFPEVQTNMKSDEIIGLAAKISSYKISNSQGWPYKTEGKTLDAWYGIPITLESNVTELHKNLFGQTDYVASSYIKEASQYIAKKTGYKK